MKSLSWKVGLIFLFIGLTIFGYAEVWGVDWKLLNMSADGNWYYDAESTTRPSKDIVRLWTMMEYKDEVVIKMVNKLGKDYENVHHNIASEEVSCSDKKARFLSLTFYSEEGKVIFTSAPEGKWIYIVPGSLWEILYEAVCK